jgi:hypothetical protein
MDERRRKALKTLLGVGAISSLVGASILTTNLLTQRHVEVVEQIINKTIVQQPINQTQVTEQVQQYNTYTTNYWDADVVVYTQNGNYYAVSHDGTTICTGSPTACIQEAINALPTMTYSPYSGVTVTAPVGKILIRRGTYNITQTITIPPGSIISIIGESAGAAVQWGGYNATVINYNSGSSGNHLLYVPIGNYSYPFTKLWLENLTFFFSGSVNNAYALYLQAFTAVLRGIQVNCSGGVSGIMLGGGDLEDTYELDNVQVGGCYYGVYAGQGFGDFYNFEATSNYYGLYVAWQGMFKMGGIHSYHAFNNVYDIYVTGAGMPIYIANMMLEHSGIPPNTPVVTNGRRLIIGDLTFTPNNWNVITSAFDNFSNVTLLSNGAYSYNNTVLLVRNGGTATFSGNGSTTQFTIAHGLATTPSKVIVVPQSADAVGSFYVTADSTYIYVNYITAPPSGTNNVVLWWYAEV